MEPVLSHRPLGAVAPHNLQHLDSVQPGHRGRRWWRARGAATGAFRGPSGHRAPRSPPL